MSAIIPVGLSPSVPQLVATADLLLALNDMDLDDEVLAYVTTLPAKQRRRAEVFFQQKLHIRRDAAVLATLVASAVLTNAQLDEAFIKSKEYT